MSLSRFPVLLALTGMAIFLAGGAVFSAAAKPKAAAKSASELPDTSDASRSLDLSQLDVRPIYEADFSKPLQFVKEDDLFSGDKRVRKPDDVDWVLEGAGSAAIENGRLHLRNGSSHIVFWNTRVFPSDFLLDFGVSPLDSNKGLAIVFFAAKGLKGESIFDLDQPKRAGDFAIYHSRAINCYHTSYWATTEDGVARGTAHIRKNKGFHLVAMGKDFIAGQGAGPHRVRILKVGGRIEVEANGKIEVRWEDDGKTFGPILRDGFVGLRQMVYSQECSYTHFKVWEVKAR